MTRPACACAAVVNVWQMEMYNSCRAGSEASNRVTMSFEFVCMYGQSVGVCKHALFMRYSYAPPP